MRDGIGREHGIFPVIIAFGDTLMLPNAYLTPKKQEINICSGVILKPGPFWLIPK